MVTGNTHFSIGVHVLTALAYNPGVPISSEQLAGSVDTNPAFLRQVIGRLKSAGLVKTKLGKGGGALIARQPDAITLLDIYRATEGQAELCTHTCAPDSECVVAREVPQFLGALSARLDAVISEELARTSVADIAGSLRTR